MTGTREKLRSLFLVTLMVGSVFAGTIAFAGTAAAATNVSYQVGPPNDAEEHLTDTTGVEYQISGTVEDGGDVAETVITVEEADVEGATVSVPALPVSSADVSFIDDEIEINYNSPVTVPDNTAVTATISGVENPEDAGTYELSIEHFDEDGNTIDEVAGERYKVGDLNLENRRFWQGQTIYAKDDATQTLELYEVTRDDSGARQILSNDFISQTNFDENDNALINTDNLEGEYALSDSNQDPTGTLPTSQSAGGLAPDTASGVNAGDTFTVSVQSLSATFDEEEVEEGDKVDLDFESNRNDFNVTITSDQLDSGDLDSIFSTDKTVIEDEDDDEIEFSVSGDQIATGDFTDIDPGEYTLDIEVSDTAASTSASINVVEDDDATAVIAQGGIATAAKGDVAQFPIELEDTDEARVNIGYNEVGFNLTADIEDGDDDGVVTPQLNLYTLGAYPDPDTTAGFSQADAIDVAQASVDVDDSSDEFDIVNINPDEGPIDDPPLDAAPYEVNVTNDGDEIGVGTLQITEASVDDVRTWTAPEDEYGEFDQDEVEELYNFVGEGLITQSDSVAQDDVMIVEFQTTSVFGALEAEEEASGVNSDDFATAFVNLLNGTDNRASFNFPNTQRITEEDYEIWIEQSDPDANRNPKVVDFASTNDAEAMQVVPDQRNGSLYVLIDTDQAVLERVPTDDYDEYAPGFQTSGSGNEEFSDGETYTANFFIEERDQAGSDFTVGDPLSTTGEMEVVDKALSYDTDDTGTIRVDAAADQVISGTTTVAPGTELNLRIRSTGTSPFLESPTPIVQSDGSFNATVDFSDRAPNTTFEATARDFDDDDTETPGVIGDAATAAVGFADQTVEDGTVTVSTATLSEGGFIVIHDSSLLEGNVAGSVIGNSDYLESGENDNVVVELDEEPEEDTTLIAMAHLDTNGNEEYNFPDADGPYTTSAGDAVIDSANITAADGGDMTETDMDTETEAPDTETEAPDTETEEPETETTTSSEGPGFTAVLAVLAMLGAALLAARRRS